MRGHPLAPAVQAGVVAGTDPGSRSVEIVELRRQRGQGSSGRLVVMGLAGAGLALALNLGIVLVVVRGRIVDQRHGQGIAFLAGGLGMDGFAQYGEWSMVSKIVYVFIHSLGGKCLSSRGNE